MTVLTALAQTTPDVQRWSASWADVVAGSIMLAIGMGVVMWVYRSMQKPRLYLRYRDADLRPIVTWQALARYIVTTAVALIVWLFVILFILTVAANNRTAEEIAIAAAVVIGASRLLAHISPEGSHELGKTIPLAVLSIILLGSSLDGQTWAELVEDLGANAGIIDSYYWALLIFDVLLTTWWTLRQFAKWDTNQVGTWRHRIRSRYRQAIKPFQWIRDFGKPVM